MAVRRARVTRAGAVAAGFAVVALMSTLALPGARAGIWPRSTERVREGLASDDVTVRRRAARRLLSLPAQLGRALALTALQDDDDTVRLLGAQASAALEVEGASERVIPWLQERDEEIRVAACNLIRAVPTPNALPGLARALGDANAPVRRAAAAALGASGSSEAVSPLLGGLDDASPAVRLEVTRALARLGDVRAVVPLVARAQDQDPEVRRAAARALGALGDPRAVASLLLALRDRDDRVQVEALMALGALRAPEAVGAINSLLAGPERVLGTVAEAATRCLGRVGTAEAASALVAQLEREGPRRLDERRAVVREALVAAGPAGAAALRRALRGTPSLRLANAAVLALGVAEVPGAHQDIIAAAQRGRTDEPTALRALGRLGDPQALSFVLEQLDHPQASVRRVASEVAAGMLDPARVDGRAVDVIAPRLEDPRTTVGERIALARVLGATGSPRAEPWLRRLLRAREDGVRIAAMEAVGASGRASAETRGILREGLDDVARSVRAAAAEALGAVGADDDAAALLAMLARSGVDRYAVGRALSGALGRSTSATLAEQAAARISVSRPAVRDALIEGLGRMESKAARTALSRLARGADADDRRKVAEALAGHEGAAATLVTLAEDPDPAVRANAVWSLRGIASAAALPPLMVRLSDPDAAVAGNAGVAVGVTAARHGRADEATSALCTALDDPRAYVRAGALQGLRAMTRTCGDGRVARRLRRDTSWRVRVAAAQALQAAVPSSPENARALYRCRVDERDASVAVACDAKTTTHSPGVRDAVLVFVVPATADGPVARAPFALVRPDGVMRLGVADRRGAVFEADMPRGEVSLAVPAALAR
ncbi:MAG: HEAT repeat domain-containing protein [Myxococcota bacterium]